MKTVDVVVLLFSILTIVMGILGYVSPSAGHPSLVSLIAGVGSGALLLGALAYTKTNPRVGRIASAVICLLLAVRFAGPFFSKHQIYPAGIMFFAGLLTFAVLGAGHMIAMRNRKSAA